MANAVVHENWSEHEGVAFVVRVHQNGAVRVHARAVDQSDDELVLLSNATCKEIPQIRADHQARVEQRAKDHEEAARKAELEDAQG
jgi:hypothetical protein